MDHSRVKWRGPFVVLLCLVWWQGFASAENHRTVLGSFEVDGQSPAVFDLVIAPCQADACPVEVRLHRNGASAGTVRLDWAAPSRMVETGDGGNFDAGVLRPAAEAPSWTIGGPEEAVGVRAETAMLAHGTAALLVQQAAGFEHVKQRHYLLVAAPGGLWLAWRGIEQQGPHGITTAVVDGTDGSEVLVVEVFADPDPTHAEKITVKRLRWTGMAVEVEPPRSPLPVVALGRFGTAAEARTTRAGAACLGAYLAVAESRLVRGGDGFVLVVLAASVEAAERELIEARDCAPMLDPDIAFLRGAE